MLLFVAICIVVYSFIRELTFYELKKATLTGNYSAIDTICSLPVKNLDGSIISDAFDFLTTRAPNKTPLEIAIENGDKQAVEILLKNGTNPNYLHHFRKNSWYSLDAAIKAGNIAISRIIINNNGKTDHGCDTLEKSLEAWNTSMSDSAIVLECFEKHYKLLVNANFLNEEARPSLLFAAIYNGNIEVAEYLTENEEKLWNSLNESDATLFHSCCQSSKYSEERKIEIAKILAEHGVRLFKEDNKGKTGYDYAVEGELEALASWIELQK